MKPKSLRLIVTVGVAALFCGAPAALAQTGLGAAQSFAVLAGSAVTNTGPSVHHR